MVIKVRFWLSPWHMLSVVLMIVQGNPLNTVTNRPWRVGSINGEAVLFNVVVSDFMADDILPDIALLNNCSLINISNADKFFLVKFYRIMQAGRCGGLMVSSLFSKRSRLRLWPGTQCCVLWQGTWLSLSQCHSPARSTNGWQIAGEWSAMV